MRVIEVKTQEEFNRELEKARKESHHKIGWIGDICWCYARNGRCVKKIILEK